MGSILKGLGLTIWGLIAFGLVCMFAFVGYQAALRHRAPEASLADAGPAAGQSAGVPRLAPMRGEATAPEIPLNSKPLASPVQDDVAHQLFRRAQARNHHDLVIEYGREMVEDGVATPDDLVAIAQSYSAVEDCANAANWAQKAQRALQTQGRASVAALDSLVLSCAPRSGKSEHALGSPQGQRALRLLESLAARAQADRKRMPQYETEASASKSGELAVKVGELYYGFAKYHESIDWLEVGLSKGGVRHLDEAYVYLGLAQQAVGNGAGAAKAFGELKTVPDISPRVVRLWTLYAETQL